MKPYTYLVGWSVHNKWYYGVQYNKDANPLDLWTTYFTSCKQIPLLRKKLGEPDVVQVRRIFTSAHDAIEWEAKVLQRLKAASSDVWVNRNVKGSVFNTPEQYVEIGRKTSATKRANPPIGWNKGLTKETDARVAAYALKLQKPKTEAHKANLRKPKKNTEGMGKYIRSNEALAILRARMSDDQVYTFRHKDGRELIGTRAELTLFYPQENITSDKISHVLANRCKTFCKGWSIS